ncbi:hypothetical protein GCM10023149_28520 [Mucilaginibacter gynuensis]|uniref:Uncharacterized protein n=1 Tax=Mucilaginibacter gynuensis TaxID=1302236 RepID=A0ABP8GKF3_9SPHI
MKTSADIKLTEEILLEAMRLLDDVSPKMGMFERQHLAGLKRKFEQHALINENLRLKLNEIDTA